MSDFRSEKFSGPLAAWGSTAEIQDFVIEHGLVIATGVGEDDEIALTGRGRGLGELLHLLAAIEAREAGAS